MPNKNTFDIKPIKELLERTIMSGAVWLDPFANKSKLATITNDLNRDYDCDYSLDARAFLSLYEGVGVDGVLYDPPYSLRQIKECYDDIGVPLAAHDTRYFYAEVKDAVAAAVRPGGCVVSFGWSSGGMGASRGFTLVEILMVPHGGYHNDTIVTVEVKS